MFNRLLHFVFSYGNRNMVPLAFLVCAIVALSSRDVTGDRPNSRQTSIGKKHEDNILDWVRSKRATVEIEKPRIVKLKVAAIRFAPAELKMLGKVTSLRELSIRQLNNEDLRFLRNLTDMRSLDLSDNLEVSDDGLKNLNDMRKIAFLNISRTGICGNGLKHLDLTNLETLLAPGSGLTDDGLAYLTKSKKLAVLNLCGLEVTDQGLKHISKLKGLRKIDIAVTRVSDVGIRHLVGLSNLEELDVSKASFLGKGITDRSMKIIGTLTKLRRLHLQYTKVTDIGLRELENLQNLEEISLGGMIFLDVNPYAQKITDAGVTHLQKLKKLRNVDLSGSGVSDAALKILQKWHGLKNLDVTQTKVTPQGVRALRKARPDLEIRCSS